jgi:NAD(P)-dependent dehydrogenase (short-subunit alcohol dehydrogenase family)
MPVALVTGSNGGFGPEIVRALSAAGWKTLSNGRSARRGPGDLHVRADASTEAGAKRLVAAAKRRFGGLDLLVCGVGDFEATPVSDFRLDAWERVFDSNLRSVWRCVRAALPELRRARGSVLAFGGTATHPARGNPRYAAYQMAKAALTVFIKSLAQAEGPRGVRANLINPGVVGPGALGRELLPRIPAGRLGEPRDLAAAVRWLASEDAAYVSGAVLDVGGGLWM